MNSMLHPRVSPRLLSACLAGLLVSSSLATSAPAQEVLDLALGGEDVRVFSTEGAPSFFLTNHQKSVASGDLNGDGVADLALGGAGKWAAGYLTNPRAGEVHVLFGPLSEADPEIDLSIPGSFDVKIEAPALAPGTLGDHLGWAVAVADVTGDEQDDLIVSAPTDHGPGDARLHAGAVYVFFGPLAAGTVVDLATAAADLTVYGVDAGAAIDSYADFLGFAVAAGDVSGDGVADLLLGAPLADGPENARGDRTGEVHVVFGAAFDPGTVIDLATTPADVTVFGAGADDRLGYSVAAGDVSGDAIGDLLLNAISASGFDHRPRRGEVYVQFGPIESGTVLDLASHALDVRYISGPYYEYFGHGVTAADLSGDGVADLVAGGSSTWNPAIGEYTGAAYVFHGPLESSTQAFAADAADTTIFLPDVQLMHGGLKALTVGDLDGDRSQDLILGMPNADGPDDAPRKLGGEACVLTGPIAAGTLDLGATPAFLTVFGAVSSGKLGWSMATGDVTDDGVEDLLLTAPFLWTGGGGRGTGEAYVINLAPSNTPAGSGVAVHPVDATTGGTPVTLTFTEVTARGQTELTTTGPGPPPPAAFRLGAPPTYYQLTTTATFAGTIEVCIDYTAIRYGNENRLELRHREGVHWVDVTTSLDTGADVICGEVESL